MHTFIFERHHIEVDEYQGAVCFRAPDVARAMGYAHSANFAPTDTWRVQGRRAGYIPLSRINSALSGREGNFRAAAERLLDAINAEYMQQTKAGSSAHRTPTTEEFKYYAIYAALELNVALAELALRDAKDKLRDLRDEHLHLPPPPVAQYE